MQHLPMFSVLESTSTIGKDTLIELESRLEDVSKLVLSARALDGSRAVLQLETTPIDAGERAGWRVNVLARQLFAAALSYHSEIDRIDFGIVGNGKFLAIKRRTRIQVQHWHSWLHARNEELSRFNTTETKLAA